MVSTFGWISLPVRKAIEYPRPKGSDDRDGITTELPTAPKGHLIFKINS